MTGQYNSSNSLPVSNNEQKCSDDPLNERSYFNVSSLLDAIPSENQVSGAGSVPAPSLKNHMNDYNAHHNKVELFICNRLSNYLFYCVNIDPGFPKTVITFPFDYFW
jgi:hypothetical protein